MEESPHCVEIRDKHGTYIVQFKSPRDAYEFWLSLRRGILAKLYQDGVLTGEGDGRESAS